MAKSASSYWRERRYPGRPRKFKTPGDLWEAALNYFEYVDDNPFESEETKTSLTDSETKIKKHKRPYTIEGFCVHIGVNKQYLSDLMEVVEGVDNEFSLVIRNIHKVIRFQKFEGAAAGLFNSNIIARDLGLKDHSDMTTNGKDVKGVNISVTSTQAKNELNKLIDEND